jgi:HSP20 family protein
MDPFKDMDEIFKRMMASPFAGSDIARGFSSHSFGNWMPPMDVVDRGTSLVVQMDLPGVKKEDLDVSLTNNRLCVSGSRPGLDEEDRKSTRFMLERPTGKFERCLQLSSQVREDSVEADLSDGVLKIVMQNLGGTAKSNKSINVR